MTPKQQGLHSVQPNGVSITMTKATSVTIAQGAKGFVEEKANASNTGSACKRAVDWAIKTFGLEADVSLKDQNEFATTVCELEGIPDENNADGKNKRNSPKSRIRKIIRHRARLGDIGDAVQADKRFGGTFNWGDTMKIATILNKLPKATIKQATNAYYAKAKAKPVKNLKAKIQAITDSVKKLTGLNKGTPNQLLIAKIIADLKAAGYNVD